MLNIPTKAATTRSHNEDITAEDVVRITKVLRENKNLKMKKTVIIEFTVNSIKYTDQGN